MHNRIELYLLSCSNWLQEGCPIGPARLERYGFQVSRQLENKAFILPGITDEYVVAHFPPDDLLESYSKGFLDFAYWTVKNFIF